jgi:phage/plasmid-associated DNA primase
LTGNDSFFARGMYEKGTDIKPMFTLWMMCNEPPKVPGHDDATWNRIRIVDYESKFVKPADLDKWPVPESVEEQFKKRRFAADLTFTSKLDSLAPYFLWILFQRYQIYKKVGLKEPDEVRLATDNYKTKNDVYKQFIDMCIRIPTAKELEADAGKKKYLIKAAELHAEFMSWYHENHASYSKEKISRITIIHEFNKRFSSAIKIGKTQGWYGYEIISDSESNDDKDQVPTKSYLSKEQPKSVTSKAKVVTKAKVTINTNKASKTIIKPTSVSAGKMTPKSIVSKAKIVRAK